jgi:hypothetical protein
MPSNDSDKTAYASPEEIAALEAQRQEDHDARELSEAEKAGSLGQAYPDDPFYGTDPADVKARRHARGAYAKEDFEPTPLDPVDSYTGPQTVDEITTREELAGYIANADADGREAHDGSDGLPSWDEGIEKYLKPFLQKNPQAFELLVKHPGSLSENAWRAILHLRKQNALPENFKEMDGDQFGDWLNNRFHGGGENREPEDSPEFLSKKEMRRMNRMANPVDFAKALDAMKWRG